MDKLKVLTLGPLPPPVGGMATVVANLDSALKEHVEHRVVNTVKTTPANRSLFQAIGAQLSLFSRYSKAASSLNADVVHIHTCSFFTFWVNACYVLFGRILGRKIVLHIHGAMFHKFLDGLSPAKAVLARWVFARCHRVIVLGEEWRRILQPWAGVERLEVVVNTVPVPNFRKIEGDERFRILCLANYERRKGQADLIQALVQTGRKDIELLLMGAEAEADYTAELKQMIEDHDLSQQVLLTGPKRGDEKSELCATAHAFCLPSYDEGLPMSMLEAMADSLPIIVTPVGSIPELILDGENGLIVDAGDIECMAAAITRIADDANLRESLARAAHKLVLADYSMQSSVKRLEQIYNSVAGRTNG